MKTPIQSAGEAVSKISRRQALGLLAAVFLPATTVVCAASMPGATGAGDSSPNSVSKLIEAHRHQVSEWDEQWEVISDLMEATDPLLRIEKVRVGNFRSYGTPEVEPIFAYSEAGITAFFDRHKATWMVAKDHDRIDADKNNVIADFREIVAANKAIEDAGGVTDAKEIADKMRSAHERLFQSLIEAKPETLEECSVKAAYIAQHFEDMGETLTEADAFRIIRAMA